MRRECGSCEYWREKYAGNLVVGECRKHSPVVAVNQYQVPMTRWPETSNHDVCGDWKAKP